MIGRGQIKRIRRLVERVRSASRYAALLDTFSPEPFNGQLRRREAFDTMIEAYRPAAIIETGTQIGNTTQYFATKADRVITIELDKQPFALATLRLGHLRNVEMLLGASEDWLKSSRVLSLASGRVVCYLDAHVGVQRLPIREELELIGRHFADVVILIDDFRVDDDPGYQFNRKGDVRLERALISDVVAKNFAAFYPAATSSTETGRRRGWIVLAKGTAVDRMRGVAALRPAPN